MSQTIERPFPWKCGACGRLAIVREVFAHSCQCAYDGRMYTVSVPNLAAPRCTHCGETIFDDAANERITQALREVVGVLSPEQIRTNREALGLTKEQLASRLGIAAATISRWESGYEIQQRAMDRLLRLYFAHTNVRESLRDEAHLGELGTMVAASISSDVDTRAAAH